MSAGSTPELRHGGTQVGHGLLLGVFTPSGAGCAGCARVRFTDASPAVWPSVAACRLAVRDVAGWTVPCGTGRGATRCPDSLPGQGFRQAATTLDAREDVFRGFACGRHGSRGQAVFIHDA